MDSRKIVFKETAIVSIGVVACTAAMVGIFTLLGYFDTKVALGGIVGGAVAILNFFFMAIVASLAADRAERQDVEGGQKLIRSSYPIRLLLLAVILFACGKSGVFNVIALVLPLLFVRPSLTIAEFFRKKGA
ncbi:MAG: hypothetical protein E7433_03265 [Ruminococcaceae bacterium]|nr:hypothetical protein [Oscillospiraceae bacterium]